MDTEIVSETKDMAEELVKCVDKNGTIKPEVGSLVYAKSAKWPWWPSLIFDPQFGKTKVVFLEKAFRTSQFLTWDKIIPVNEEFFEEQIDRVCKLIKREAKKPLSDFIQNSLTESIEILREFRMYDQSERHAKTIPTFELDQELKLEENSSVTSNDSGHYDESPPRKRIKTFDNESFDIRDIKKKFQLPKYQKPWICAARNCNGEFFDEIPVFCHDFPFHLSCLEIQKVEDAQCKICFEVGSCFLCEAKELEHEEKTLQCSKCDLYYHITCLNKNFPQVKIDSPDSGTILCPYHVCHTCFGENHLRMPRNYKVTKGNYLKCLKCPTSYHKLCVPVSSISSIMSKDFIICPKHEQSTSANTYRRESFKKFLSNASQDEILVTCAGCPRTVHLQCVLRNAKRNTYSEHTEELKDAFKCTSCLLGLCPLPGQTIIYQLSSKMFWPAHILNSNEISIEDNVPSNNSFSISYLGGEGIFNGAVNERSFNITQQYLQQLVGNPEYLHIPKEVYNETIERTKEFYHLRESILPKAEASNYKKIEKNQDRDNLSMILEDDEKDAVCLCSEDQDSPEICTVTANCSNRSFSIECTDETCSDANRCVNRMFSSKKSANLQAFITEKKGFGLKTLDSIKKDDYIIQYCGEVIPTILGEWRLSRKSVIDSPRYIFNLENFSTLNKFCIDAEFRGNLARHLNHSCAPNCYVSIFQSNKKLVIGIFASEDIPEKSELTIDYAFTTMGTVCHCESSNCTGKLNAKKPKTKEDGDIISEREVFCKLCLESDGDLYGCELTDCDLYYHPKCIGLDRSIPPGLILYNPPSLLLENSFNSVTDESCSPTIRSSSMDMKNFEYSQIISRENIDKATSNATFFK